MQLNVEGREKTMELLDVGNKSSIIIFTLWILMNRYINLNFGLRNILSNTYDFFRILVRTKYDMK